MQFPVRTLSAFFALSCAQLVFVHSSYAKQSKEPNQSQRSESMVNAPQKQASDSARNSRASLPNSKEQLSTSTISRPITLKQVERQTGGKVIGSKPVDVQGRQLNQIKMLLPNGRVVIHQQLFDEQGRSVETVNDEDDNPDLRTKSTDQ
jgi:hypothetical protein